MEIKEIFRNAEQLYQNIKDTHEEMQKLLAANLAREKALKEREARVAEIESAAMALAEVKKISDTLDQKQKDIAEARAAFENWKREELEKVAKEIDRLNILKDKEAEIIKDREALRLKTEELEKEKLSYKARIKEEMIKHFKNSKNFEAL